MRRVIIHAGFHKTGTTSVQRGLRENRALLRRHARIVLRPGMVAVCETARAYSLRRDALTLAALRYELATVAEGWQGDQPLLIASEDLSGHMPGRAGLTGYDAVPRLMATMAETLTEMLDQPDILFHFSTRAARPWLASCYAQHLKTTRITQTRTDYCAAFAASADFETVIDAVQTSVAPHKVSARALESFEGDRLGPLTPLLDLLGVSDGTRAALPDLTRANAALPEHVQDRLLALNRSDLDKDALRAAKSQLYREVGSCRDAS